MTARLFLTTLFVIAFVAAIACLNESRVLLSGRTYVFDSESLVPSGHYYKHDEEYYEKKLKELDRLWKRDKKIEDYSDYGVLLVYAGRYEEAKQVFTAIEKISPGRYATAANLGTTYELLGQNKLALEWINKAVEIDPTSHNNSEWLHVKILEAKIKGDKYVTSDFLIATNFGTDTIPKSTKDSSTLVMLRDALYYQLNERVSFIQPKEKIVALLLFELGNICAITDDVTTALRNYDMAKVYGFESEVLNKRYAHFLKMQTGLANEYSKKALQPIKNKLPKRNSAIPVFIPVTLLVITAVLFIRRKKLRS